MRAQRTCNRLSGLRRAFNIGGFHELGWHGIARQQRRRSPRGRDGQHSARSILSDGDEGVVFCLV